PYSCFFNLTPAGNHFLVAQNGRDVPTGWIACRPVENPAAEATVWSRELSRSIRNAPTCVAGDRFVVTESWWEQSLMRGVFRYVTCSTKTGEVLTAVEGPVIEWWPPIVSPDGQFLAGLINARVVVFSVDDFSKSVATIRNDN